MTSFNRSAHFFLLKKKSIPVNLFPFLEYHIMESFPTRLQTSFKQNDNHDTLVVGTDTVWFNLQMQMNYLVAPHEQCVQ